MVEFTALSQIDASVILRLEKSSKRIHFNETYKNSKKKKKNSGQKSF